MITLVSKDTSRGRHLLDRLPGGIISDTVGEGLNICIDPTGRSELGSMVNSCLGMCAMYSSREKMQSVATTLGFSTSRRVTTLYSVFNGKVFGDWLEIQFSGRFMNRNIGPELGFVCGLGFNAKAEPMDAVKRLGNVKQFLQDIGYVGEVRIGLDERFEVTGLLLGHVDAMMAMYQEIGRQTLTQLLQFCGGEIELPPSLYDNVVAANLVSQFPFPGSFADTRKKILAPSTAEKHLWRFTVGGCEPVLVTTHGVCVAQCRARLAMTVANMRKHDDFLQYRTDVGQDARFLFAPQLMGADGRNVVQAAASQQRQEEVQEESV